MKIAILAGHHPGATGAFAPGYTEHYEAAIIAAMLAREVRGHLLATGPLPEKIKAVNDGGFDLAVEVHLNAGGGRGSETLYHHSSGKGKAYAVAIEKALSDTGRRSRGAKVGWYRMDGKTPLALLQGTKCPALIFEAFFIDGDGAKLGDLQEYYAIAQAVGRGLR